MPTNHRDLLKNIRTFPSLVKYLRDELDWPIQTDDFEELTFEYTPEELGIDIKSAAKIQEIKRLRPLSVRQPWGIFFVKFEPKRLPVVALRRILSRVVVKKRASANSAERASWELNDLLFVSNYGEGEERRISLAHFSQDRTKNDLPTLKVLGWDNLDTPLHLDHVSEELRTKLIWPDDEKDSESWRQTWHSAFTLRHREVITTSKALAVKLAELARDIRARINTVLAIETEKGPITKLMKAFKETLVHDLDEDGFADMYAQTIAYGLLSARITNPEGGTADDFAEQIPITNPFLKELMETFLSVEGRRAEEPSGKGIDFDELGVREVVELLDNANIEAVIRDFGDKNPQEDPVIHFYELFLSEYDAKKRMKRGVFYTPRPVVSFIVRSVDELLRSEFDLEDGLADTTTWGEMADRHNGIEIPEGVKREDPFVQIIDPATGTSTFLVEVIGHINEKMTEKWKNQGYGAKKINNLWNEYVAKHLLTRIFGYEFLIAPYAIAHMKIGLKLYETGYLFESKERVHIYLTNALEPPQDFSGRLAFDVPALAHEANAVNGIKSGKHFTVIIGNPPYSGISANRNEWSEAMLKGKVSTGKGDTPANYYSVNGEPLSEKKIWLKDDYVKFIRLSHYLIEKTSVGIHGMISNHSFVDSPTCRGMRSQMNHFFSKLQFIDLHGSTKKSEISPEGVKDENVFDILPGVAISVCVKSTKKKPTLVQTYDLWGTRSIKSDWLLNHGLNDIKWTVLSPSNPYYLFVKRQLDFEAEYHSFDSLKDIFPFYGTGIQTSRDQFATDFDREELEKRLQYFFNKGHTDKQVSEMFGLSDTRGWKINDIRRTSSFAKVRKVITKCLFRTFDEKWIALTKDVVDWPRLEAMSCVGPSMPGLLCSRQQATRGFRHALVVNSPVDMFCISNKSREGQTLFPMFVRDDEPLFRSKQNSRTKKLNVSKKFSNDVIFLLEERTDKVSTRQLKENEGKLILNYAYAIMYSLSYRFRYADLLKMDYPRIPLTGEIELFNKLAIYGGELVSLHLMQSPKLNNLITTQVGSGKFTVEKVSYSDETVWINKAKTQGFHAVSEKVWNFHIGGYQVCEKWLKDRQAKGGKNSRPGRVLTKKDIDHYQKIVVVLNETIRIMKDIDEVIEEHGGWPGAFSN